MKKYKSQFQLFLGVRVYKTVQNSLCATNLSYKLISTTQKLEGSRIYINHNFICFQGVCVKLCRTVCLWQI